MAIGNRPLSPHLQVYRPQITSILSITHRMTGVALAVGALLFAYWLTSAAYGPETFATAQGFLGSWVGLVMLAGFTFSLYFHLCNGLRHLAWDAGWGFEMRHLRVSGLIVVAASVLLTGATWIVGLSVAGGY